MYFLYSVLTVAATLVLGPYFVLQSFRHKRYVQNLPERLGFRLPPELGAAGGSGAGAIWIHAVSVGEALAAVPLARALKQRLRNRPLVVSTTTLTGQALVHERMKFADAVFYFPLDWRGPVRRALRAVRPGMVIVFETEIWPNFLREARRAGVPVVFVNGRLSEASFRRFSRALRLSLGMLRGFLRRVLSDGALYLMQSEEDSVRLISLGAPPERVVVTGNMKYDVPVPETNGLVAWLEAEAERSHRRPVLVAGSVIAGEEPAVLEAMAAVDRKWPEALLILAPRKPERFDAAAGLIEQAGRRAVRRSSLVLDGASSSVFACAPGELRSVLLLDTIGELAAVYQLADAVFVGGSLECAGGHNPLEPAALGKVPLFGPSMDNFREIAGGLLRADAAIQVRSGAELGAAWTALLADDGRRNRMGQAARQLVERHRGATAAVLGRVTALLAASQEPG